VEANISPDNITRGLFENQHLLPSKGKALDLACGKGADAIFMASHGLNVDAWDISDRVIEKLSDYASDNKLSISAKVKDVVESPPPAEEYDVISVSHYLDRSIIPDLILSLKTEGIIIYQTFTQLVTPTYSGPSNPGFRLKDNELLSLFKGLKVIVYHEESLLGDVSKGLRNEALLIAQKV